MNKFNVTIAIDRNQTRQHATLTHTVLRAKGKVMEIENFINNLLI